MRYILYMAGVIIFGTIFNICCTGKKGAQNYSVKRFMHKSILEDFDEERKEIDKLMK